MRDTNIADICKGIYDIALPLVTNLADYGINTTSMLKLKESIDIYRLVLPTPREGIVDQSTFTHGIELLFEQNSQLLYRADKLVTMLRFDEPIFWEKYFKCRKIIDSGSRRLSLKGNITDEQGLPITNVIIQVESPSAVATKSTALGNYQFKGIEPGVWPVTFNRDGFKTEKVYLVFSPNQRIDHNIMLKSVELQQQSA